MTTMNQQTIEQLQQEIARLQTELKHNEQRSQVEKMKEKNVAFSESLIQKGRLKPKHRAAFVAMLNFAEAPDGSGGVISFGEGDERQPLADAIRDYASDAAPVVSFGEFATKDNVAGDVNPLVEDAERRNNQR
jgi:TolA-binding protein